jgi:ABC-2 type transport system ATP-binding protein
VVEDAVEVRRRIGLAAQDATVDDCSTGRDENLVMIGELHHLPRKAARARADELLDALRIWSTPLIAWRASTPAGMRRRLDLSATIGQRGPRSCSWTSRPPAWTRVRAPSCGASSSIWSKAA